MKRISMRWRLMGGVAVVQIAAAVLATILVVNYEEKRSLAMLQSALVEHAAMVASVIEAPDHPGDPVLLHRELLKLPANDVFVLSDPAGHVIAASGDWRPVEPLPTESRSFVTMRSGGHRYRVMVAHDIQLFDEDAEIRLQQPVLTLVYGARMSVLEKHERQVAWIAACMGLAILLASLAATAWVVSHGLQPLLDLAQRASGIDAANWALDLGHAKNETIELVPLSTALSRLVDRLHAAFLRERQFSADAAHEMKTAIAIVKSTLQLTLERPEESAAYRRGIERALEDTERMQALASGMLQLAKIEGLAAPARTDVRSNVQEVVEDVERELLPLLAARNMTLRIQLDAQPLVARIAAEDLHTILKNLVENAIHYSEDGANVEVAAEDSEGNLLLTVTDSGCGIAADALPHVFERFYRGDASRSRDSGGAGLGLAITQAMAQRAGGSVAVASTPGEGSRFSVILPRA